MLANAVQVFLKQVVSRYLQLILFLVLVQTQLRVSLCIGRRLARPCMIRTRAPVIATHVVHVEVLTDNIRCASLRRCAAPTEVLMPPTHRLRLADRALRPG